MHFPKILDNVERAYTGLYFAQLEESQSLKAGLILTILQISGKTPVAKTHVCRE